MAKLARVAVQPGGPAQWAVQHGQDLVGLGDSMPAGEHDMAWLQLADKGVPASLLAKARPLDPDKVEWRMPIARPGKVICLGLNYAAHAAEGGNAKPEYPSFFMRGATSLIAHRAPLSRPRVSEKLDFEAELAVIIGQRARHLSEADALRAVAGYACFNDGTLRDYQKRTSQWTIGKNFDGTGAFGPWLVPAADLPPGAQGLKIESRLNGQVMQSDNTSHMIVTVAHALALLSEVLTLEPGDVIAMGTPAGVGYARTPPVWMKPGDRIEIEVENVGLLSNPVVQEGA
jgi:2-keto-4-pentenoate hydratase/2-oxohepta-3-ene-1,7-dioic acid hydratase in catechol pathway